MVVMMGGMMLGMKGAHKKHAEKSAQAPVAVSSSPVQGTEPDSGRHRH
ncbi:MAG: hypothetical protein Q8T11_15795 [Elusimicrobiota bacterium]|nr:hypothetical protein [Elusimicrobiota bacterium]